MIDKIEYVPGPFSGKSVTEGNVEVRYEDGGQAMIITIYSDGEEEIFIRLQSWSETKTHTEASKLLGKRVRVVVDVIE